MKLIIAVVAIFVLLVLPLTYYVNAQASDFQTGYSDGNQQGLSDRHNNVFRIGNICLNQSNSYCNGYLSGYLDGFFSTLPLSMHTTTIIHESHREKSGCHDNMTGCKSTPTPTPTPKPTPTLPPTPPNGNSTK